jgi:ParB family chromosome partitioning protein
VKKQGSETPGITFLPPNRITPNPDQPRTEWDPTKDEEGKTTLQRLGQSIKEQGLLQPIIVTPRNGHYMIVCGERRFRSIKKHTSLKKIPCIVKEKLTDTEVIETSITENLQREDLTPVDEARAFKLLMDKCKYTQKKLAKRFGISVAAVNYKLSLLKLSPDIQEEIKSGKLSETEGRTIAQAVNKVPAKEKKSAMKEIQQKVGKARKNGKVKTKEVATIAKTVVEKKTPVKKGKTTRAKTEKPKPPTAKEKTDAKAFAKAVTQASKLLGKFNGNASKKAVEKRLRFAYVLLETQKDSVKNLAALHKFTTGLSEEIAEVKRQRMVAKLK